MMISNDFQGKIDAMEIGDAITVDVPDGIKPMEFRAEAMAYAVQDGKNFSAVADTMDRTLMLIRERDILSKKTPPYSTLAPGQHTYIYPGDYGTIGSLRKIVAAYAAHNNQAFTVEKTASGAKVTRTE